jgi:hypothetical protein
VVVIKRRKSRRREKKKENGDHRYFIELRAPSPSEKTDVTG